MAVFAIAYDSSLFKSLMVVASDLSLHLHETGIDHCSEASTVCAVAFLIEVITLDLSYSKSKGHDLSAEHPTFYYTHSHIHTYTHTHAHTHEHTHTHVRTHTHAN